MELLNRSLRALQGIYDDPMLPSYQKGGLEMSEESEDEEQQQSGSQNGQSQVIENAAENIVIEFNEENRVDVPISPQSNSQVPDVQEEYDEEEEDEFSEDEYRKTVQNIIQIVLYSALKWSTVAGFLCVMLIFTVKWHLPCLYVLLLVCLVDMFSLVNTIRGGLKINSNEKNRYKLRVLQGVLSLGAKISIIIYKYIMPFRLIYSLTPALLFDVLHTFILMIRYKNHPSRRFYRAQFILKAFYLGLVSCVALKLDGIIPWHWREVFMSYWGIFGIMIGVTIVTLLVFLNKFLSFFLVDRRNFEFYGILWLTLLFSGFSACSGLITYKLQKVLEHELSPNALLPLFIIAAVYCVGFTVFTTIHFKKLEIFFQKTTIIDEEQQVLVSPVAEKKDADKPASPKKLIIPRFLTKSSNTYFRKVTQGDIDKNKARMNRLKAKNAKFKTKQPRQRQNSFDQGTNKNTWIKNFALVPPNPELLTIPETDRDKLKTEVLSTARHRIREDIKPLNILQKKGSEGYTIPSDRSRAGLIGSYRSTVGYNENTNGEETTGTLASARRMKDDKLDSYRNFQEEPDKIIEADEEDRGDDGFSLFLEDIRPLSARRANSLNAIPDQKEAGLLSLIPESESNKENSRLEASEMMTSPTLDASTTQQCLICFDKQPDAVFMECGHGGVCYECSLEIWKTTLECYLCRKKINQVLQIDPKHKIGRHIIKVVSATQMVMSENQQNAANQNQNNNA